ncbi:MAG TPA: DUF3617 family protein [Myxococcota bacterium]|nr:DUF3617 family protein [Myxococcota bacterium]
MIRSLLALALLAPLFAAPAARAEARIETGEWEQVMTVTAPEMPSASTQTVRHCITKEDASIFTDRDRWAQAMVKANPDAKCRIQETKQDGNALTVVLACEGDMRLDVRQEFQGTTGTIDAETRIGGATQGKTHIVSKRVADTCSQATIEQWKRQNPGRPFAP